jgi:hypothetical protein
LLTCGNARCWTSRCPARWAITGGCDFAARPSLSARDEAIFWTLEADTSVVLLSEAPSQRETDALTQAAFAGAVLRSAPEGLHLILKPPALGLRAIILPHVAPGAPLAALIPLDRDGLDRIDALAKLYRALHRLPVPRDGRITLQQRRRLKIMLRASDGRTHNAGYREIAEAIYGHASVAAYPWKTSPLRDNTMALVRDGRAMIAGGYRKLLRYRRRPSAGVRI